MTLFSRSLLAAGISLGVAFSAMAGQYQYEDTRITINIKGDNITAESCALKDGKLVESQCSKSAASIKALSETLKKRVAESTELLDDPKLLDKARAYAESKESEKFKDDASGKSYVMISLLDGFNLPLDLDLASKNDYSLVKSALESHRDRYERALKVIESGKLPANITTDRYSEVSGMLELENVVKYAELL